jgi:hypothetical protein
MGRRVLALQAEAFGASVDRNEDVFGRRDERARRQEGAGGGEKSLRGRHHHGGNNLLNKVAHFGSGSLGDHQRYLGENFGEARR